ncbi:MAG: hypothetical protein U9Q38_08815, partial [Thermodesulfobacteriota bacterium]|nr:hypothetical protein [Thermodesulfobacteriota bacterium]
NTQYENYKTHLTSLAGANQTYADGVNLLDIWLAGEKQKLWDAEILQHGSMIETMDLAWRDFADNQMNVSQTMYDGWTDIMTGMKAGMTDILVAGMKGDWDSLQDAWTSLWDNMLDIVIRTIAEMAVQAASVAVVGWITDVIFAAQGVWDLDGSEKGSDTVPAMLTPGEMVIPKYLADRIRDAMGEGGYSNDFAGLQQAIGDLSSGDLSLLGDLAKGTAGYYGKIGAGGLAAFFSGQIDFGQFVSGMTSPEAIIGSVLKGGIPEALRGVLGVASIKGEEFSWSDLGSFLGYIGMMVAGVPGVLAAVVGKPLGAFLGDLLGDALDARGLESVRDAIEDAFGNDRIGANRAFQAFIDGMGDSGWNTGGMLGWGGFAGLGIGNPSSYGGGGEPYGDGTGGYGGWGGIGIGNPGSYGGSNDPGDGGFSGDTEGGADSGFGRRSGGFSRGPASGYPMTLHGAEEVVPLDEPYRSRFRDAVGMDPEAIAAAITKQFGGVSGGNGRGGQIHVTVNLGNETLGEYVAEISDNVRIEAERRDAGDRRIV